MHRCTFAWTLLLAAAALPRAAHAIPIVEIVFLESGTPVIAASPGDSVTAEIRITSDEAGVSSYGVSLEFDSDLDLVLATELLPAGFAFNLSNGVQDTLESQVAQDGHVFTFEAATFGNGPVSTTFAVGTIQFTVKDPQSDGVDLRSGLFNAGIDGFFDNAGESLAGVEFGTASVVPVPEPGALWLLVAAVALAGRRPRAHSSQSSACAGGS